MEATKKRVARLVRGSLPETAAKPALASVGEGTWAEDLGTRLAEAEKGLRELREETGRHWTERG